MHILTSKWLTTVWCFQITWRAFTSQGTMWYWLTVQSTWTLTMEVCTHIIYTINTTWLNALSICHLLANLIGTCCFLFFDGRLICVSEKHFPCSKQYISYLTKLAQGRCNVMISRTYSFSECHPVIWLQRYTAIDVHWFWFAVVSLSQADPSVVERTINEEEKRIHTLIEHLNNILKTHNVSHPFFNFTWFSKICFIKIQLLVPIH